jgi:SPP1 family predicted phage head-tail adaptor
VKFPAPVNPGNLRRHRAAIRQNPGRGVTVYGSTSIDWTAAPLLGYFWGSLEALQGRELEASEQRWAEARFKFRSHYIANVNREDRLECEGRIFDIVDAEDPTGQRREIHMTLRELVQ